VRHERYFERQPTDKFVLNFYRRQRLVAGPNRVKTIDVGYRVQRKKLRAGYVE
jgi:hypothetical protein